MAFDEKMSQQKIMGIRREKRRKERPWREKLNRKTFKCSVVVTFASRANDPELLLPALLIVFNLSLSLFLLMILVIDARSLDRLLVQCSS